MGINWKEPGWIWVQHTLENVGISVAGTILGVMLASKTQTFGSIDWAHTLSQAAFVGLTFFLTAVVSLKAGWSKNNGTASLNPNVVAAPRHAKPLLARLRRGS